MWKFAYIENRQLYLQGIKKTAFAFGLAVASDTVQKTSKLYRSKSSPPNRWITALLDVHALEPLLGS